MKTNKYLSPSLRFVKLSIVSVLCASVGGNTGYDDDDNLGGGELTDDDD